MFKQIKKEENLNCFGELNLLQNSTKVRHHAIHDAISRPPLSPTRLQDHTVFFHHAVVDDQQQHTHAGSESAQTPFSDRQAQLANNPDSAKPPRSRNTLIAPTNHRPDPNLLKP
ncbi:unnamed protein product [Vicia faba]|uniref:Uncharacterized protein n=1 Tax=Vicia faba TaxID=3906 RepID=A0AAV0YPC4_VICFA|nr:unnamed protein product [Vicia faba]